jgi:hypothetical protein
MMTQWMHGYHSLSEAVAYDGALHAEKVKADEHQAEDVSDLKVKVKAAKANTAPIGAKMKSKEKQMRMPIGPRRAKARKAIKAIHMPNHQRVDNHTVPIRAKANMPIQQSGKSLTSKVL